MAMFMLKDIQNEHDLSMLRKGRCPWCFERLTPVFQQDEHVSDQCVECDDVFATTMQAPSTNIHTREAELKRDAETTIQFRHRMKVGQ